MDRNDWIDLLAEALWGESHGDVADSMATDIVDTRIPAACPDCGGPGKLVTSAAGERTRVWPDDATCTHPNAPTVEQALTVGLRTLSAEAHELGSWYRVKLGNFFYADPSELLRALRGEDA